MISEYNQQDFADAFNSYEDSVRVLAILSPTCTVCLLGYEIISRVFVRFNSPKLKGFVIWTRKSEKDNEPIAKTRSESKIQEDTRLVQFWDSERSASRIFGKMLHLDNQTAACDVYLLYAPRIKWENENLPPEPAFWMHQLTSESSIDQNLRLDYAHFSEETKFLLETEDPDLADSGILDVLLSKKRKGEG